MKIKVTLILLFVFIFIRLIKILNLFFTIKIGRIYTSRVGHIAKNLENYIHETRNEKGLITFFGTDKKIANNFLLKLFKRKNIFFGRFFFFVYMRIKDRKDYFDLLVSENKLNPNFSLVAKEKLNIKIPKKVDDFGSKFLNDNKIDVELSSLRIESKSNIYIDIKGDLDSKKKGEICLDLEIYLKKLEETLTVYFEWKTDKNQ